MKARACAAALVGALLLTGCIPNEGTRPGPQERNYPPAPPQQLPEAAEEHAATTLGVPIAELADPAWLQGVSERTEVPQRALAAYAGASLRLAETQPECGLGWNTLAGIGAVESVHGSYGGASITAGGVVDPAIIGVPLDGSEGVMGIPDTDGGELDGDEEWDRAVGPMQFIPTTWERYAQDGNADGQTDPHQFDDAALTAALYLCEVGGDFTTDDGWAAAIATYNRSVPYARQVSDRAEAYLE